MNLKLTDSAKKYLLNLAREAVAKRAGVNFQSKKDFEKSDIPETFLGAFVTLKKKGSLRGCIGYMEGFEPLERSVPALAASAAFEDPRFPPLSKEEFWDVDLEITILSPMEEVAPEDVLPGRDGLFISGEGRRGVLLPQVATEYGWSREEFLNAVCEKAGLSGDFWKTGYFRLLRFEGEVFGEKDFQ